MDLSQSHRKLAAGLVKLREMYDLELTKPWYSEKCHTRVIIAGKYLIQSEERAAKIPYLLSHGATKQATKMIQKSRESFHVAFNMMKHAIADEEKFRLAITEEIHLS